MDNSGEKQIVFKMTPAEKRAIMTLAGALGLSVAGWTKETLQEKWEEKFPDMEYPDENGQIKPKQDKKGK